MSNQIPDSFLQEEKNMVKVFSKVTTISPEGIRFFEKKGIIHPEFNHETGYRVYGGDDTNMIVNYRKLRKFGFSLPEAKDLLAEESNEAYLKKLLEREEEILKEIEEKEKSLSLLKRKIKQVKELCEHQGQYSIVQRPAFYWMHTRINKSLLKDSRSLDTSASWAKCYPFPDTLLIWDQKKLLTGDGNVYFGHLIEAEIADGIDLPDVHYAPSVRCLYTANETLDFMNSSFSMFDDMLEYMKQQGLTPKGDAIARKVRTCRGSDGHYHYHAQLWIPI